MSHGIKYQRKKEMDKNKEVCDFFKKSDYRKAKERVEGRNYAFCRQLTAGIVWTATSR
jgi:hypothetical protein